MGRKSKSDGSLIAYAWRTGRIDFGHVIPNGCLVIAMDQNEDRLRKLISGMARHSYPPDNYLLVPGVPEAQTDEEALMAFTNFFNLVVERKLS